MDLNESINRFLKATETDAAKSLAAMQADLKRDGIPFDLRLRDELMRTFRQRVGQVYDEFQCAQSAEAAKTSKRAPIAAKVHPFVSEIETVQDGMATIGLKEATKSATRMKIDVFGDTVTQSNELAIPAIEIKTEPIDAPMGFWNFDNKRFYCYHCQPKNDLGEPFSVIADVHAHWTITHMQSAKPVPFLFVVSDCFACYVCGTMKMYHELLKHADNIHPAIIVDRSDRKQCSLCAYNGDGIIQHFQKTHKMIFESKGLNPMRLTDEALEELLTLDVHKQLECDHCQQFFDTKTQVQLHHKTKHPTEQISMKKVFNNRVVRLICSYCDQNVESHEYFQHVLTHIYPWKCLYCDFHGIDLDDLMEHDESEHMSSNVFDDIFKDHSNLLESNYFRTKVVFGNGLILIKHNLLGTKAGDREAFDAFMAEYESNLRPKSTTAPAIAAINIEPYEWASEMSIMSDEDLSPMLDDCVITDIHQEENNDLKEQNVLDKNVSIHGIPVALDSQLKEVISMLCKMIGTDLTCNAIRRIHRLPGEQNEVIINFKTYEAKSQFMNAKWPSGQIQLAPDVYLSPIDVRHHMTDFYLSLWAKVCIAEEKKLINSCKLTRLGIAIKRTACSEIEFIRTEEEAQNILNGS